MASVKESRRETDVLIVGAGPVGLALRLELERLGIATVQVDQHAAGLNTSRAAVIHARTLEVLAPCGVVPALLAKGIPVPHFRVRENDRILLHIGFGDIPSDYRYALMCPQNETEAVLRSRLGSLGATIERPVQFLSTTEAPGGLIVELAAPGARSTQLFTRWIVGCDGAHSKVRDQAGIAFAGDDYAEQFVLADVHMDWPLSRDEVSLFFSANGLMVVAPLPEEDGASRNRYRIVATVSSARAVPGIEDIEALLLERGPRARTPRIDALIWSSRFHLQHRIASHVFKNRTLLCGDAAHVHSPAGGQGMNTGIQDAVALAPCLAQAVCDGDTAGLTEWAAQRHRVASEVVRMTDAMTRAATAASPVTRALRDAALGLVGKIPLLQAKIAERLAELGH
ncbi:MAG: FAD-dependent monooxygenase [Oxalobacteraceae bacterium]|nr:MAG: FAD-dependent monooxygenase [Oxalobacteraceae bacterium]